MTLPILRRCKTPSGAAYVERGNGEPLLLLHGVGMRAQAWQPQLEALSLAARVIALDLPGHGASKALSGTPDLRDFVSWFAGVVDELALDRFSLIGHSMGALIAAGYAVTYPERLTRLALFNAVYKRDQAARCAVQERAAEILRGHFDRNAPLSRWFAPNEQESPAYQSVQQFLHAVDKSGYAAAYQAFAEGDSVYADDFAHITCPALFLTGADDQNSTPQMATQMAKATPQGRAIIINGHRHMVNLTAPLQVNGILLDWLKASRENNNMSTAFDARALRDAFGAFLTGVTVVTSTDQQGKPLGFTANSFSSVSLEPPLLSVCLAKTASSYPVFSQTTHFAVNILGEEQKALSNTFARPSEDRFAGVNWQLSENGSPILKDTAAWFDCSVYQRIEAGDHLLLLGEVKAFNNSGKTGLGYARGAYFTPAQTENRLLEHTLGNTQIALVAERDGQLLLLADNKNGWQLPALVKTQMQTAQQLPQRFAEHLGVAVQMGLLYSLYDDTQSGQQHIVYRANLGQGAVNNGKWFAINNLPLTAINSSAERDILKRYAQESRLGNFGIYLGDQHQGKVHTITA